MTCKKAMMNWQINTLKKMVAGQSPVWGNLLKDNV